MMILLVKIQVKKAKNNSNSTNTKKDNLGLLSFFSA